MILKQYYLGCLAHASYLIGDTRTGTAVVVDPQRDIDQYVADAEDQGLAIRHVFLTHFHADFVAGHLELRDRVGARICLGARAEAEYDFTPFSDGDDLDMGAVRLRVLETPGHTPEGISILVFDLEKDAASPYAALTGDTLFIGDVGRPDLLASVGIAADDLAGMLYDSLREKLLPLPDQTLVYPSHGAGSLCGKNLSTDTVSTIGEQRRYNYALQPMSKGEFVALVTAEQPEAPAYFATAVALNRSERPTLERSLENALRALSVDETLEAQRHGAQVVDVRVHVDYAGAHLAGSINIGLGGDFAPWAGSVLDMERPIVIVGDPGAEKEAATRLGRIGFDRVAGYLDGGMLALDSRADLVRRTERITPSTLAERLATAQPPFVLDVRREDERQKARIAGSHSIPLGQLARRIEETPRKRDVVVHCAAGYRSSIAVSILEHHGYDRVSDLVGGLDAWKASGLATES